MSFSQGKQEFEPPKNMPSIEKKILSVLSPSAFRALTQFSTAKSRVIPIDSTWFMPNNPKNGFTEFTKDRIPRSVFFDLDKVCDKDSPYPHMLPNIQTFNEEVSKLGIKTTDSLVFYDKVGNFSAPRAAWTFSLFNHKNVYLLNHFPLYHESAYPLDESTVANSSHLSSSQYESSGMASNEVISYETLLSLVETNEISNYQLFDARSNDRFTGESPEPRKGLSSGHVPTAVSLPFTKVLNADKTFLSRDELVKLFGEIGVVEKPIIVMCGTGVTAVILKFAFEIAGYKDIAVYDGSWTEWAQRAPGQYIVKDA